LAPDHGFVEDVTVSDRTEVFAAIQNYGSIGQSGIPTLLPAPRMQMHDSILSQKFVTKIKRKTIEHLLEK